MDRGLHSISQEEKEKRKIGKVYDQTCHRKCNIDLKHIKRSTTAFILRKVYNKAYTEKLLFPYKISKDEKV